MSAFVDNLGPLGQHQQQPQQIPIRDREFILYQQNPIKQMLLYDMATSSSVFTFLKMHGLETTIKNFTNTEFMSENGRIPVVIEANNDRPMCGFKEVYWHVCRNLERQPSLSEIAYNDWIETKFLEVEMYICWCHEPIVEEYTRDRYTYDLPWPVSSILFNKKRREMAKKIGNRFRDLDHCLEKFNQFLGQVNKLVGNRPFAPSAEQSPSSVNALIYGHATTILSTKLNPKLSDAITRQRRIENLVERVEELYMA